MKCILCSSMMSVSKAHSKASYYCSSLNCINEDMPRYTVTMNSNFMVEMTLMIGEYYIKFNHINQITEISKLTGCILEDTITIHKILDLNQEYPQSMITKIKTLMLFS